MVISAKAQQTIFPTSFSEFSYRVKYDRNKSIHVVLKTRLTRALLTGKVFLKGNEAVILKFTFQHRNQHLKPICSC